jgi:signal transduction histidine kinase
MFFFSGKSFTNDTQGRIDSLIAVTNTDVADSVMLVCLLDISYYYQPIDTVKMWEYYHKTVNYAQKVNRLDMVSSAQIDIGNWYYYTGDLKTARTWYLKCIYTAREAGDLQTELLSWLNIADLKSSTTDYDRHLEIVDSCLKVAIENEMPDVIMPCYGLYGLNYWRLGDYDKAMEFSFKSLKLAEDLGWEAKVLQLHNNIGLIYRDREEYDKALIHLKQSMKTLYFVDPESYHHIGRIYMKQAKYDLSQLYLDSCETIAIERNNQNILSGALNSKAELAILQNKVQEAKSLLIIAKDIVESIDQDGYKGEVYLNLSSVFRLLEQYDSSLFYANKGIERSLGLGEKESLASGYRKLSETYQDFGDFKNGLQYIEKYNVIRDSILNEKRLKNISVVEIKYETAIKDLEIEVSRKNLNRLKKEKEELLWGSVLVLGLLVMLSVVIASYFKVSSVKKENQMQADFTKHILLSQEIERKRIASDLHDSIGQNLLLIKSNKYIQDNKNMESIVTQTLEEVRSISRGLHPVQLERLGFTAAIEEVIDKCEKSSEILISDDIENIDKLLTSENELNLYRIIQECLSNVLKHSKAKSAKVDIRPIGNKVVCTIQDNGIGFNYRSKIKGGKSIGLTSLNERVKYLGGKLTISSASTTGTMYKFVIPIG